MRCRRQIDDDFVTRGHFSAPGHGAHDADPFHDLPVIALSENLLEEAGLEVVDLLARVS